MIVILQAIVNVHDLNIYFKSIIHFSWVNFLMRKKLPSVTF